MLSETDVHYLVGLLTRAQEADDVVVELGDMVLDIAAGKKRDVDITAIYTDETGARSAYKGIEVKNHLTRPLTVEQVEQLCLKLRDMPDITHGAIVSASGYTKGAVNKARAHMVELLEIVDWHKPGEGFNVKFNPDELRIIEPIWTEGPQVAIDICANDYKDLSSKLPHNPEVCDKSGDPIDNVPDVEALSIIAHKHISDGLTKEVDQIKIRNGDRVQVDRFLEFADEPCIKYSSRIVPITTCQVTGSVTYKVHDSPLLKVLRTHGSQKLIAGCVVVETADKSLLGLSINNLARKITCLNIPHVDRQRKKIKSYRLTLTHTSNE